MEFIQYTRDVNSIGEAGGVFSSALVPIFYPKAVIDPGKSKEAGYPVYADKPHIKLLMDNGLAEIDEEVEDVPSHPDKDWKRKFPVEWSLYEKGVRDTMIGTPLSMLFNAFPSKVEAYKRFNVYTVEQLAAVNDGNITGMGLGALKDREDAKQYISHKKDGAVYEALEREREAARAENETLRMQLSQQAGQLASLQAQLQLLVDVKTSASPVIASLEKRGRGRPKKVIDAGSQ